MDTREKHLDHDENRIAGLIGTLRHVDAPGDFESHVRARIADRRDEKPRVSWRPVFAGAAAVAVLIFAGYLGLRSLRTVDVPASAPGIANTKTVAPTSAATDEPSVLIPTPAATQESAPSVAITKPPSGSNGPATSQPGGGSIDEASKAPRTLSASDRPTKDYVPSQHRPNDNTGLGTAEIPVTMILDGLGIHVSWGATGWRVDSVSSNSVAGRTGLKPGDVIESLDGQTLGEKTSFKGSFSGKSIRVRRNGAVLDLPFKP